MTLCALIRDFNGIDVFTGVRLSGIFIFFYYTHRKRKEKKRSTHQSMVETERTDIIS